MRVVLDTNVYISAIIIGGDCEKLLKKLEKEGIEILISLPILEEITKVLKEKFSWDDFMIQTVIYDILQKTTLIEPKQKLSIIKAAKADNRILECALEGKAHFLISGDKRHILPLKKLNSIKIVSPKEFLKKF